MGIHSNKILSAIALVLVLTVIVSIIGVPTVKAEDVKPSAAVFEAFPNPVAVGDTSYIEFDISPDPPSGYRYEWITVTIVMPDESIITLGPFMADSSGGVAMSVVFPDTGTYSAKLNYPGQMMGEDWYLPFLAGPIYIEVVEYLPPAMESVHNLDTGLNYSAIQDAIDAPETLSGHTILVDAGRYYENVAVTKSISLIGENSSTTIIDGRGDTTVVNVTNVDNVEISGFRIQNGDCGFHLLGSSNVTISGNTIIDANTGIFIYQSNDNSVYGNSLTDNDYGINLNDSSDNAIFHNNFINNIKPVNLYEAYDNVWDDGFPSGGNYWSNYNGIDSDGDGIGDTPHIIDENNTDNYPLMASTYRFDAGTWKQTQYFVDCVSNSTVSGFYFDPTEGAFLQFNVEGENGTSGFCRVTIPKELLHTEDDWVVLVDGASVTPTVNEDASNTYLYFAYNHSIKSIEIRGTTVIPEFQSWALILFILTALAVAVAIHMTKTPPKLMQKQLTTNKSK